MNIRCIVMASGLSKRMGQNKLLMKLGNKPIYQFIIDRISTMDFYSKVVVAKDDEIIKYGKNSKFETIINLNPEKGQSESIRLSLEGERNEDGFMFFVADQPLISHITISRLVDEFTKDSSKIIIPYFCGKKGNPVIFPKGVLEELKSIDGDKGGSQVIKQNQHLVKIVEISAEEESFDIDTMEQLDKIRGIYER